MREINYNEHIFSICAYKESAYLETCIKSIIRQTVKSDIIICTSTPNEYIFNLADKYNLSVHVRNGESDIRNDWNFAYNTADKPYVTVVHQDDVYSRRYTEQLKSSIEAANGEFDIYFTDYRPLKKHGIRIDANCIIRGLLRLPMRSKSMSGNKHMKRLILSLGNSICCPTVTYNKAKLGKDVFTSEMKFNIDWDTFLKLAEREGRFLYNTHVGVLYRIHDEATSKEFIDTRGRETEDRKMFMKFWPEWLVDLIMIFYKKAYETYF